MLGSRTKQWTFRLSFHQRAEVPEEVFTLRFWMRSRTKQLTFWLMFWTWAF